MPEKQQYYCLNLDQRAYVCKRPSPYVVDFVVGDFHGTAPVQDANVGERDLDVGEDVGRAAADRPDVGAARRLLPGGAVSDYP